jgi:hypothetical protein
VRCVDSALSADSALSETGVCYKKLKLRFFDFEVM